MVLQDQKVDHVLFTFEHAQRYATVESSRATSRVEPSHRRGQDDSIVIKRLSSGNVGGTVLRGDAGDGVQRIALG